jgi:zinc transporter, ZIP family
VNPAGLTLITALLIGSAASSALVIGALMGSRWRPPKEVTGVLLAFASGALISALAFELFDEAFALGGAARSGLGLLAGAAVFVTLDTALDRHVGRQDAARSGVCWALLAAVTLDGIPENLALGTSLVDGTSLALLVAIFSSNLPEAIVGAIAMHRERHRRPTVIRTWLACAALLTIAVVVGRTLANRSAPTSCPWRSASRAVRCSRPLPTPSWPRPSTAEDRSWRSRRRAASSCRSSWPRE